MKRDSDDAGFVGKTDVRVDSKNSILPATCKMDRP
jgi:hypothetical protein